MASSSCVSKGNLTSTDSREIMQKEMKPTFGFAMASYAVMALIAILATDGKLRLAVLILLVALALKTWIARTAGW
jgi:hypothetical protein